MNFMTGILKGMALGVGAIAPGVSGGALAVVFGLYDKITYFIANFTKDFKKNVIYFMPVGIGGIIGVLVFSRIIEYLFKYQEVGVKYAFIGLMLGTMPSVVYEANKKGYRKKYLRAFIISLTITLLATYFENSGFGIIKNAGTSPLHMVIYGTIIGFGTIIPGVSASIILMYVGAYEFAIGAISNLQIYELFFMGIGFVLSVLLFAKVVCLLFEKAYGYTYYTILGLVVGSIVSIFPGFEFTLSYVFNFLLLFACMILSYSLSKLASYK